MPVSSEAEKRLYFDDCVEGDLVEIDLEQSDFDKVWNSGCFAELNSGLGLIIDDHEDERIPFEKIDDAIAVFNRFLGKEELNFPGFYRIGELLQIAREKGTGLFFFF